MAAMDTNSVKVSINWRVTGGCDDLTKAIQTKHSHEDIFIKPNIDELIGDERAVLLCRIAASVQCELQLRIFPSNKIEAFSIACSSAPKLEVFYGPQKEYMETVYGDIILDEGEEEQPVPFRTYRYDIEVEKSGVADITIKLLTADDEICIYGMILQIAPNPNGITSLLPNAINIQNVQQMLDSSSHKLSDNAEKCKMFMQMYGKSTSATANHNHPQLAGVTSESQSLTPALLAQMKQMLISEAHSTGGDGDAGIDPSLLNSLKLHIDMRMQSLECKIIARLNTIDAEQSKKLDRILQILEEKK